MNYLVNFIHVLFELLSLMIIIDSVLSFFMSPFHPIRQFFAQILNPLLSPIRRIVPLVGMMDFSPLILLILIQIVDSLMTNILLSIR